MAVSSKRPTYSVLAVHVLADGSSVTKTLHETNNHAEHMELCRQVLLKKPRQTRSGDNGQARELRVVAWADPVRVAEAKHKEQLKFAPPPGTSYPSAKAAAEALGIEPHLIRQYLYRARKAAGEDVPAVIYGLKLEYAEATSKVSL